jgi:hypothetical protein
VNQLRALKSVPNGVGCSFGTIGALRLVQNVSDVGRDSIETDRQHQRNVLVRPPDGKQTKNLDLTSREVVRKSDTTVPGVQQRIDIGNQARHSKSTRELVSLAQLLKAQAPVRLCLPCCQESTVPE